LSIIETLAVFVGIPLAVVAMVFGLVYAGGGRSNDRRYRPGRPYDFAPVWFLSAPDAQHGPTPDGRAAVTGANRMALTKADAQVDASPGEPIGDVTGGASDRW
jgi:hypothetical protein